MTVSLDEYQQMKSDLVDSIATALALWEERHRIALAYIGEEGKIEMVDDALLDLTSPAQEDDEEEDDESEPTEPIGEEAFENSYIGGGGSPDLDNL